MDTGGGRTLGNEVDRQRFEVLVERCFVLYTGDAGFNTGVRGEICREGTCMRTLWAAGQSAVSYYPP